MTAFLLLAFTSATSKDMTPPASEVGNPELRTAASPGHESPGLQISLLTIGPGPIFFERFGHNAIVVRDTESGDAVAYNYGVFDFEQDDFFANFANGTMQYQIIADDLDEDIAVYRDENRTITEQSLAFTPEQAARLDDFLRWNAEPEHRFYRYDYYESNCSTRVRDALDEALGGAIRHVTEGRSRGYTYRMDSLRLMAADPALMLAIDLGLGPYADQRVDFWQESFVPAVLAQALGDVESRRADGATHPLVTDTRTIAKGAIEEAPDLPPDLRLPFLVAGVVLGLAILFAGKAHSRGARVPAAIFVLAVELFCSSGAIVLLFLWLGTAHRSAWRNENLLLLSPLALLLVPAAATLTRASPRVGAFSVRVAWIVAGFAGFALFSKILPWFAQANLHWILLFLPIHVAIAIVLTAAARERIAVA
jgi:hypothetical protein